MAELSVGSALNSIRDRMVRYVGLSENVVSAIAVGDEGAIRRALAQLRMQRDAFTRMLTAIDKREVPQTRAGIDLLRQFLQWRKLIAGHDEVIVRCLQTWRRPDAELLQSALGVERFVDLELPFEWNVQADLIVLGGNGSQAVAHELVRRGQKRLYVYWPSDERPIGFPPQAVVFHCAADFQNALCGRHHGPPPQQVLLRRLDPSISDGQFDELMQVANQARVYQQAGFNATLFTGEQSLTQRVKNLAHVASVPSVTSLFGAFAGRPAIIVSPGPSLAKNIEAVAQLKRRAVILTSVQTIAPLAQYGLVPDLSLNTEPVDTRYVFGNLSSAEVGRLGLAFRSHPLLFEFGARVFTFSADWNLDAWICSLLGEDSRLASGGSVSCSAFTLALHLGCDPIVLCGQDLSYASTGEVYLASSPHARSRAVLKQGTVEQDFSGLPDHVRAVSEASRRQAIFQLPGYHGGTVDTSADFAMFHRWFESMTKINQRRRFFNCTEGGVYISGMAHRPLAEVAAEHMNERFDVEGPFRQAEMGDFSSRRQTAQKWRESTATLLERAVSLARRCQKLAEGSTDAWSELGQCEAELSRALGSMQFISLVDSKALHESVELARVATTVEENLTAARQLYQLVLRAGDLFLPLLR